MTSDLITEIQEYQNSNELCWLISNVILPEFPQIIEALQISSNLIFYNSPQVPDPANRIERGPSIKLPVSTGKLDALKGIMVRDGACITELEVSIREPHVNKHINKLHLVGPLLLQQLVTTKEEIDDAISILNELSSMKECGSDIHKNLISSFNELLNKIQTAKTSLQLPIDPMLVFPLNITDSNNFEPVLPPSIAIDFYISQAEVCIDLKSLHRVTEKPWCEIDLSTGKSYIDKLRDEMKLPTSSQASMHASTSRDGKQPQTPPLHVSDVEKRLQELVLANSVSSQPHSMIGNFMSHLQLRPKHEPVDYITKCMTYNNMVVMVNKKIEVSSPDPVLMSAFTKLDSVEYMIGSFLDNLHNLLD